MARGRAGYINVDELMPKISLEQVAAYYGVSLPELIRVGDEIRTRCFLNCGRTCETGDRALAIKADDPVKRWRCHQYDCGKGGNLVSMCDLLKAGTHSEGRPRGQRFKEIAADIRAMAEGAANAPDCEIRDTRQTKKPVESVAEETKVNRPLAESDNERARGLVNLDDKFITEVAEMNAKAAAYFRRRPFLSSEVCRKWRVGYLPRSTGKDRSGGTMRGTVVYPLLSERDEVLTWFGRDPSFEEKYEEWGRKDREGREPEKYHFVKGFHRGLELFGQHGSRLREDGFRERLSEIGILIVEGPNDVIALDTMGVPAVGLCSNTITKAQVEKVARWARRFARGNATVMLDCDDEGVSGAQQVLSELCQHCRVRLAWSPGMFDGRFRGREPETLSRDDWELMRGHLTGRQT